MVTIKKTKYIYPYKKIALLWIFLLLWLFGQYGLVAAHFIANSVQEEPMASSIWEEQIDPALAWSPTPFYHPANQSYWLQTPDSSWQLSSSYFRMGDNLVMPNSLLSSPNFATAARQRFSIQSGANFSVSLPSTTPLPASNSLSSVKTTIERSAPAADKSKACGKKFKKKDCLEAHVRRHMGNKLLQCTYCSKSFKEKSILTRHLRSHTKEKPYLCTYCHKKFTQKSNFKRHLRVHTKEKPYVCIFCHKKYPYKGSLTVHLRTHTKETPYLCTYCPKKFIRQSSLTIHLRTHTQEKPFQCSYCQKSFKQRTTLVRHIRTHTLEKPYLCSYCSKKFAQKGNLKRHLKSQHN